MPKTFQERVAKLGLGDPKTWPGEEIDALITVNDIDRLKDILDVGLPEAARDAHMKALFEGVTVGSDRESRLLHRVHDYVFGNGTLSSEDRQLIGSAFPLEMEVKVAEDKTINTPVNLGTSTSPVIVNYGTLTMNQGGFLYVENTLLTLTVDTLVRNGNTGVSSAGDFNIMGVIGKTGTPGTTPGTPGQAQSGAPGNCSSAGIAGSGGGNGSTGATGTIGGPGAPGGDGLPSMPATITINKEIKLGTGVPQIIVRTMSGPGGYGGPGGTGGTGGQGGNGGNGVTCGCTGNSGGSGGIGGTGGQGGNGGAGGNGVDAAGNVTVFVPAAEVNKIVPIGVPAQPGNGGAAGAGGSGGAGGGASSGGKHNSGGPAGGKGADGPQGSPGPRGTVTGKAAQVNVQPT